MSEMDLETAGSDIASWGGGLRHASGLRHSEQNVQLMKLESIHAVVALHNATYTV